MSSVKRARIITPTPSVTPITPAAAAPSPVATITSATAAAAAAATVTTPQPVAAASAGAPPEQLQSAVYRYIQRRRYAPVVADTYRRISQPPRDSLIQTKQAMALRELLSSEASNDNTFAFTSHNNDPTLVDQQYSKFKLWISESLDAYKPELAQLLYPMFTHLYLDLVASGHKMAANKFLKKHQSTFHANAEFAHFIRQLNNVASPEDIGRDEVISGYLSSKYSVTLSNRTFHYLMKYLQQDRQPPILLQLLHSKVDLRLSDVLSACSKVEAVDRLNHEDLQGCLGNKDNNHHGGDDGNVDLKMDFLASRDVHSATNDMLKKTEDWQKLQETIRLVRESPTPLPSICLYRLNSDASCVTSAKLSLDARHMAVASEDTSVQLWSLYPAEQTNVSRGGDDGSSSSEDNPASSVGLGSRKHFSNSEISSNVVNHSDNRMFRAHSGPVYDLSFVPNTSYLVSCSEDTTMRLWDVVGGANRSIYRGHAFPVWSLDVDRLGVNIATGSMDRTAKLWHLEYTHPIRVYAGHESDVDVVRFHPNCNYLATAGADKTIRLWTHADAKMVRVFSGHRGSIYALAFSPDGRLLASAGEDRRIRLWNLATAGLMKELRGHADTVYSLVFSADSSLLASAGLDGSIRMWNVGGQALNQTTNGPQMTSSSGSDMAGTSSLINNGNNSNGSAAVASNSTEQVASYQTGCANIINLCYSPHNTLVASGIGTAAASGNYDVTISRIYSSSSGHHSGSNIVKSFHIVNGGNANI